MTYYRGGEEDAEGSGVNRVTVVVSILSRCALCQLA
jgi:hypothetical protein